MRSVDKEVTLTIAEIERISGPSRMTQQEALEYLESISSALEGRIEALRSEIQEAKDDSL